MKPVTDFLPYLIPVLPGVPEPFATRTLVDAAIAFCDESLVVRSRVDLGAGLTIIGSPQYTVTTPPYQQVSRVLNVWVDGVSMRPVPLDSVSVVSVPTGAPSMYYVSRYDADLQVNLYPAPDRATYVLAAEVAYRPIRSATFLQDDLFNLWLEPLVQGTISRLAAMPNLACFDVGAAQRAGVYCAALTRKARVEGGLGSARVSKSVFPVPFA